jgi:hypothetical protein
MTRIMGMGFVLSAGLLLLWTSCTKAHLYYYERELVRIYPDRTVHALPALEYHFYSGTQEPIRANSDNQGNFEGELLFGTYRVIATNTAAATNGSVAFSTSSYESATVTAQPTEQMRSQLSTVNSQLSTEQTRSQLSTLNSQLSTVYSVVVEELSVRHGMQPYRPTPVLLTKQLELVFTLSGGLETEIKSIAGVLPGVYSAVYLATGLPTPEAVTQSPNTAVRFNAVGQGTERKAEVSLLGLRNPEYGAAYTNSLELTLSMNDDSEEAVIIDLTQELSDIFALYQGVLPSEISVEIQLERSPTGGVEGTIGGSIKQWKVAGEEITVTE